MAFSCKPLQPAVQCGRLSGEERLHVHVGTGLLVFTFALLYFPCDSYGVVERWLSLFVPWDWIKKLSLRLAAAGQHKKGFL